MQLNSLFRWGQIQVTNPTLQSGITAHAGGTQAAAVQLNGTNNVVTITATNGDSVKMPNLTATNVEILVANKGTATLSVYPQKGGNINGGAVDAAFSITTGHATKFISIGNNNYTAIVTFAVS